MYDDEYALATNMEFESYGAFGELSYQFNDQHKLVTARVDQAKIDA
jgi:iron complex outermembrane receptor protein